MASKPYIATGNYINKMSNYCKNCPKDPKEKTGENACPFTTLYWDYLIRHQDTLKSNNRMGLQLRNLDRLKQGERSAIGKAANKIRSLSACRTPSNT
jgi:deoxyribodipyrimidine photolyase-related protein